MSFLKKAIGVSFFLYAFSTLTTMAGMEIFSWLTFVLVTAHEFIERKKDPTAFFKIGPDWALLGFFIAAVLGLVVNGSQDADWVFSLGGQRWVLLVYMTAYAAKITGVQQKAFYPLLVVACIACLHGLLESLTGWDYLRHQAVGVSDSGIPRAMGLFSLPTRFASSFGMVFCFIVAALLLKFAESTAHKALLWGSFGIVGLALLLSETRGAWIAIFLSVALICFLVNRKIFVAGVVAVVIAVGAMFAGSPTFRTRLTSLTDMNYESNSDRIALWKLNAAIFKANPLFGIGLDENERRKKELAVSYGMPIPHQGQAHNTYLQIAAGAGSFGLICYLVFVGLFLTYTIRLWCSPAGQSLWERVLILGALGAQISLHIGGMVDCNFRASEVRHLFILVVGIMGWLHFRYMRPKKV